MGCLGGVFVWGCRGFGGERLIILDLNKEFPWYFDRSGGFGDFLKSVSGVEIYDIDSE